MGMLGYFVKPEKLRGFEEMLRMQNQKSELRTWFRRNIVVGAGCFIIALCVLIYAQAGDFYITMLPFCAFAAPFIASYFIAVYKFERRKRSIEALVPDVLLQASIFPKGTPAGRIIKYLARADYGQLSAEFEIAHRKIENSASVEEALNDMKRRNRSRVLVRALDLLLEGYNSGADMGQTFKEAAEDLLETNSIIRERVSSMVVEKYTLLFAGGIIVPLVLGLIVGLVSGLDFANVGELGIGMDAARRAEMISASLLANQVYIAEYALIASLFVANQEGNMKNAIVYAALLLPLSVIVYNLAQAL
ncbi:MAG: type II secretion system F family protein [Candidatus Diapherotrites archaeon]